MRRFVSATVAAIIALHSVLGCCWHHAHEATAATIETEINASEPVKEHSCRCHSHRHDVASSDQHDDDRQNSDDSSPTPAPCEGKCDTQAVDRVQHDDVAKLSLIALNANFEQPLLESAVFKPQAIRTDDDVHTLPVRLHLLHQLLLI